MSPLDPPPGLNFLASLMEGFPSNPSKWTRNHRQRLIDRLNSRVDSLDERIGSVVKGRVIPDVEDVNIGSGSQCRLAVLFLDICGFSQLPNWAPEEQKSVLALMNLFMAEMISTVRDFDGRFEKNTGDGLMAYVFNTKTPQTARKYGVA
jgi:class 3 adenylate cyclase